MKIFTVQSKSFSFGEIDSGDGPYYDKRDTINERRAWAEGRVLTASKLKNLEYKKQKIAMYESKIKELEKLTKENKINIFRKISYNLQIYLLKYKCK